ncbi:hypothetical protein [Paenibacillus sp. GXUN7292]|uniref:hypothetical protein n=1 Tax=Paenibacillus sp. GXUN7292 TaxID=3422499 RepID=UPI003D7DB246
MRTSRNQFSDEELKDMLYELPLDVREELAYTNQLTIDLLHRQLGLLSRVDALLKAAPVFRIADGSPVQLFRQLQPMDIISVVFGGKRSYYYIMVKREGEQQLCCIKLTKALMASKRFLDGYDIWNSKISISDLRYARLERQSVPLAEIGAPEGWITYLRQTSSLRDL